MLNAASPLSLIGRRLHSYAIPLWCHRKPSPGVRVCASSIRFLADAVTMALYAVADYSFKRNAVKLQYDYSTCRSLYGFLPASELRNENREFPIFYFKCYWNCSVGTEPMIWVPHFNQFIPIRRKLVPWNIERMQTALTVDNRIWNIFCMSAISRPVPAREYRGHKAANAFE